jgi:hypothetical protein
MILLVERGPPLPVFSSSNMVTFIVEEPEKSKLPLYITECKREFRVDKEPLTTIDESEIPSPVRYKASISKPSA